MYAINVFDYITLACKFLNNDQLKDVLNDKIKYDVAYGNIAVIALVGLSDVRAIISIQNFIDKTGDLQTAAYVANFCLCAVLLEIQKEKISNQL